MTHPAPPRPMTARPGRPLAGTAHVAGDKSMSHRAVMLGALAVGDTRIEGLLEGEDVRRTAAAMAAMGAGVERLGPGSWRIRGVGVGGLSEPDDVLDMGNSGTAARLLLGVLAGHPMRAFLTGDASLRSRPMDRVADPLRAMGARIDARAGGRLPLTIQGRDEPAPLDYRLPVASAQVKSAILMAGLAARGATRVRESRPTRDHTERMARHFGADVRVDTDGGETVVTLIGQPELMAPADPIRVPRDVSSAAFALVAGLVVPGSRVALPGVGLNPTRTGLIACLEEMGAALRIENRREEGGEPLGDLTVEAGALAGIEVPADRAPSMIDEYPILAVAAACAKGTTRFTGVGELRVKESDRLAAVAAGLAANGVSVRAGQDWLEIDGRGGPPPGGGTVETRFDHRIAMAFLVLGLAARKPVTVDDGTAIATSFPDFAAIMAGLGADIDRGSDPA